MNANVANEMSPANARKLKQLRQAIEQDLPRVLTRGFFGNFTIEMSVQDGTIQTICRKVERIEK